MRSTDQEIADAARAYCAAERAYLRSTHRGPERDAYHASHRRLHALVDATDEDPRIISHEVTVTREVVAEVAS